jgi:FkbM family methyltransferase
MLIPASEVISIIKYYKINVKGVLHVGAHECEEMSFYKSIGLEEDDMVWIDAIPEKVELAKTKGIKNMYQAVVTDRDGDEVEFNVSSNGQSSSIFDFGTHSKNYTDIKYVNKINLKTSTLNSFFKEKELNASKYNFWNMDIQGAELIALKGANEVLNNVEILYVEINTEEVYKGCGLVDEIDAYLLSYGLKRVKTHMTHAGWGDAIYVKC